MYFRTIYLSLLIATTACATTVPGTAYPCEQLDRVVDQVKADPGRAPVAFELLKLVARGMPDKIDSDAAVRFGIEPERLLQPVYRDLSVRAHALRKIGQLGLPESLVYLEKLTPEDFDVERGQMYRVWPPARIALHEALLNQIPDEAGKIAFLERTVQQRHDAGSNSAVKGWGRNQLCDRGASMSWNVIYQGIRFSTGNPVRFAEEVKFCEDRMRIVQSAPDRVTALASALRSTGQAFDRRLMTWAVTQLLDLRSPRADAVLDQVASEIDKLDPERKREWGVIRSGIRTARELRSAGPVRPVQTPQR
jgi:hypothetical protein